MNPLISVDIGLYFEVSNSDMFGGEGTVGYSATKFEGVGNLDAIDDSFVQKQIEFVAQMLKVTSENVRLISKEEYDHETADEDDDPFGLDKFDDFEDGDDW